MSSTSTYVKTVKKQAAAAISSPQGSPHPSTTHQVLSVTMSTKEKDKEKSQQPTLITIQETLNAMKDFMFKSQEDAAQQREAIKDEATQQREAIKSDLAEFKTEMADLKVDMGEKKAQMKEMQQTLQESEDRVKKVEEKTVKIEKRMDYFEGRADSRYRRYDESITHLEMQRASYGLRFQNIIEEKDEDLKMTMAETIGGILQVDHTEILKEIDEVFRISNTYIRRHNLPREIHIKFARKTLRDDILHWARTSKLQHKGFEVKILKQVPRGVRESRRDYHFLTRILIKENITFRWLIPEGIALTWRSRRYKLENLEQATDFFENSGISHLDQSANQQTAQQQPAQQQPVKELAIQQVQDMGATALIVEQDQGARRVQPQRETKKPNK